jgi:putative membrane protein
VKFLILFVKGLAIGVANVIPGVSGGTMAFILGIYHQLTEAVGNLFIKPKKEYILFLLVVGFGGATGIVLFAKLFGWVLESEFLSQIVYFFFIGLILGSVPYVLSIHNDLKPSFARIGVFVIAIVLILFVSFISQSGEPVNSTEFDYSGVTLFYGLWLVLCGFLAAGSMVLPGFSGSALLIGLGEYANILGFVNERMLLPLGLVVLGSIPGVLIFAKLINYTLNKFPANTYYFILGLILASLIQIYQEINDFISFDVTISIVSIIMLIIGFASAYYISKIKKIK